jgi:hypothetical protein
MLRSGCEFPTSVEFVAREVMGGVRKSLICARPAAIPVNLFGRQPLISRR